MTRNSTPRPSATKSTGLTARRPTPETPTFIVSGSSGKLTWGSFDGAHTYEDDGRYVVTITLEDDAGGVSLAAFHDGDRQQRGAADARGRRYRGGHRGGHCLRPRHVLDDGALDEHTVTVSWGDGTPDTVVVLPSGQRNSRSRRLRFPIPTDTPTTARTPPRAVSLGDSCLQRACDRCRRRRRQHQRRQDRRGHQRRTPGHAHRGPADFGRGVVQQGSGQFYRRRHGGCSHRPDRLG